MIFPNALHKKRKPIRHTSTARAKQLREYRKVKHVFLESHGQCSVCSYPVPPPFRAIHHWAGRVGRLLFWEPGFRLVCPACHGWIHENPKLAIKQGHLAPWGTFNDYDRAVAHYEANK